MLVHVDVQARVLQPDRLYGDHPREPRVPWARSTDPLGQGHVPGVSALVLQHHNPAPVPRGPKD